MSLHTCAPPCTWATRHPDISRRISVYFRPIFKDFCVRRGRSLSQGGQPSSSCATETQLRICRLLGSQCLGGPRVCTPLQESLLHVWLASTALPQTPRERGAACSISRTVLAVTRPFLRGDRSPLRPRGPPVRPRPGTARPRSRDAAWNLPGPLRAPTEAPPRQARRPSPRTVLGTPEPNE